MRTAARGESAHDRAARVYRRFLAAWAGDVLALRRLGFDRPGYRPWPRGFRSPGCFNAPASRSR